MSVLRLIRGVGVFMLAAATLANGGEPGAGGVRQTCLACLKTLQEQVEALIRKHPQELGHLGPGTIDRQTLSLHFPVTDPRRRFRNYPGRTYTKQQEGIFFQFSHPIPTTAHMTVQWLCIDAGLVWGWAWAGGRRDDAAREATRTMSDDLHRTVHLALRPLDEAETAAVAADLARRDGASYVLRGHPGIELSARYVGVRGKGGVHTIELHETNRTGKPVALYPLRWEHTETLENGKLLSRAAQLVRFHGMIGPGDPFVYLAPGEGKRTFLWSRGKLPPGRHRLRFVVGHVRDGWTDMTPTYLDGAPVYRRVENAWLGVVVSNELEFTVDEAPAGGDAGTTSADPRRP